MPAPLEDLPDTRDRLLATVNFRVRQVRNRGWQRLRPLVLHVVAFFVSIYRRRLRRPVFIGVTGSCGKTTTKEMTDAVLSSRFTGHRSRGNNNVLKEVVRSVLRTKRDFDYCVQEFGVGGIGEAVPIEKQFAMFKPRIGVVTTVGDDHIDAHGSREAIAAEKGKLIASLPADGTAVLNADDPLVLAMQSRCRGKVLTYGLSPDATVHGEDVRDDWPNRLSLTVRCGDESARVQTQICGAHLVPNVLAAVAVGRAMGVGLQAAADAIGALPPVPGRMYPVECSDGVTFIRDDVKAPVWTIPPALEWLHHARATRKIIVLGNLSDYQEPLDPTYLRVAKEALEVADYAFFVGRWASRSLRAKRHPDDQSVQAFVNVDHLNGFLQDFLEPGDLVLIKGSKPDQLSRIVTTRLDALSGKSAPATSRAEAATPAGSGDGAEGTELDEQARELIAGVSQLVVGLGNPGKRFEQTPHNVGQQALDVLAETLGATWSEAAFGLAARAQVAGDDVLLVKPATHMNRTGPLLRELADHAALSAQDCLVIHDDINLKEGVLRNRLSGSSGGHKGVQSIIAAFQSEDIRRVKIGVGPPPEGMPVSRYVLTPVRAESRDTIDDACGKAAGRVHDMIKAHARDRAAVDAPAGS